MISVPATSNLRIILGINPQKVDLDQATIGENMNRQHERKKKKDLNYFTFLNMTDILTRAGISFSSRREMKARVSASSLADKS